jgi:hypothetical protein
MATTRHALTGRPPRLNKRYLQPFVAALCVSVAHSFRRGVACAAQTRWFEMEEKARLEATVSKLTAELARERRQSQRPHHARHAPSSAAAASSSSPSCAQQLRERPATVPAAAAAMDGASPPARTPLTPRPGQEASPVRTPHLSESNAGPQRQVQQQCSLHPAAATSPISGSRNASGVPGRSPGEVSGHAGGGGAYSFVRSHRREANLSACELRHAGNHETLRPFHANCC